MEYKYHWPKQYTVDGKMLAWCGRYFIRELSAPTDTPQDRICSQCQANHRKAVHAVVGVPE